MDNESIFVVTDYLPEHVSQVHEIEKDSFAVPWSREALAFENINPNALYLVALCGLRVVGYAGMHVVFELGSITNIAVAPEMRRLGIADLLLKALIERGVDRGVQTFTLEVRASNIAAQALYTKHGFESVGTRRNYYTHPNEDAVIMNRGVAI